MESKAKENYGLYLFIGRLLQLPTPQNTDTLDFLIDPTSFYKAGFNTLSPLTKWLKERLRLTLQDRGMRVSVYRLESKNVWGEHDWGGTLYVPATWRGKPARVHLKAKGFNHDLALRALTLVGNAVIPINPASKLKTYQIAPYERPVPAPKVEPQLAEKLWLQIMGLVEARAACEQADSTKECLEKCDAEHEAYVALVKTFTQVTHKLPARHATEDGVPYWELHDYNL